MWTDPLHSIQNYTVKHPSGELRDLNSDIEYKHSSSIKEKINGAQSSEERPAAEGRLAALGSRGAGEEGLPRMPAAQAHRDPILPTALGTFDSSFPPTSEYSQRVTICSRLKSVPQNFMSTRKLRM